jgi:general secretion pathway protein E
MASFEPSSTMGEGTERAIDHLLLRAGLKREDIDRARRDAVDDGDLGSHLEAVAKLPQGRFAALVAEHLGLPFSPDVTEEPDIELLKGLSLQFCRRHRVLPLRLHEARVTVATSAPFDAEPLGDLRVHFGKDVAPVLVPAPVLRDAITRAFDRASSNNQALVEGFDAHHAIEVEEERLEVPDLLEADDEAPIIRLVNGMIFRAAKDGASDIHVEPFERNTSIRYRIDGLLAEVLTVPRRIHGSIVSRIKVMAAMNVAEKRLPQDGGIRTRVSGREIDIRVSTLPTSFGERVVMRLLDRSSTLLGLEELGLSGGNLESFRRLIHQSHGIVLVTGPTGSGKTTTLYAALSEINSTEKNIITIEDPVEYQLPGVGQIQVNPKIDLTFAAGLRSILRQDPDVIMVGEIRDAETARIAIQAALTGHLVFSTLHTNDSFSAITRLLDMGIEAFLVSSSVIGILAQRLVRRLCPSCSLPVTSAESGMSELGLGYLLGDNSRVRSAGPGCPVCRNSGHKGRTLVQELLVMDDTIRGYVMKQTDAATIRDVCVARGMPTVRDDGVDRIRAGVTSVEEVLRVTSAELE